SKVKESEFKKVSNLEDVLKQHIIGQDEAVKAVCAAVKRSRVQISPRKKPASFIFVGPTGVGKTELVKVLAKELFNQADPLIRLDMSEFMEKHSISRIIGSPPGYVGYDEAGQLTEKIRRKPYSVILFDEIEKAHPDVMNILLQILDEGKVTDAHGRNVNFQNTVIVMTSNAGSDNKTNILGFDKSFDDITKEKTMKALSDFLRPEFLSRVDEIIVFDNLKQDAFEKISALMLDELKAPLEEKGINFTYNFDVAQYIGKISYDKKHGARDIRKNIRKEVEDKIANVIVDNYENVPTKIKAVLKEIDNQKKIIIEI
ncbi:MAG: AAA family ATPase, partial [Oscillospiraceae bacterium]